MGDVHKIMKFFKLAKRGVNKWDQILRRGISVLLHYFCKPENFYDIISLVASSEAGR